MRVSSETETRVKVVVELSVEEASELAGKIEYASGYMCKYECICDRCKMLKALISRLREESGR